MRVQHTQRVARGALQLINDGRRAVLKFDLAARPRDVPQSIRLPTEPFAHAETLFFGAAVHCRELLREINQNDVRLDDCFVVVNDHRHLGEAVQRLERGFLLRAFHQVDMMIGMRNAAHAQHQADLAGRNGKIVPYKLTDLSFIDDLSIRRLRRRRRTQIIFVHTIDQTAVAQIVRRRRRRAVTDLGKGRFGVEGAMRRD